MKVLICFLCCLLSFALGNIGLTTSAHAQETEETLPYQLPIATFEKNKKDFYLNRSDQYYADYHWQSFIALNWPAKPLARGVPDTSVAQPAIQSPVVWETYPQPQEVFLPSDKWGNYPEWNDLPYLPAGMTVNEIRLLCRAPHYTPPRTHIVLYDINQPNKNVEGGPVGPLVDQHRRYVRYQVNMNQTYFEYVRENQYYRAETQSEEVQVSEQAQFERRSTPPPNGFVPIPFDQASSADKPGRPGMLETKAAWRLLGPKRDDLSRYYRRRALVISPDRQRCWKAEAGLVALHIHRSTRFGHTASTFEQIVDILPRINPWDS